MEFRYLIKRLGYLTIAIIWVLTLFGCNKIPEEDILNEVLASEDTRIKRVMDSLSQFELQIMYTQIERKNDSVFFKDFEFQLDDQKYFYPASTVKFPATVAALEQLNEIDSLTRATEFYVEGDSTKTTFARAIEEIFAVSDNAANNRLIEFLGFDDLNFRMRRRGVSPIRISHRLSTSDADNVTTKPLVIYTNDSTTITSLSMQSSAPEKLSLRGIKKGKGFYSGDSLHSGPFDFSLKNYFPIRAQSNLLKRIIFPEAFPENERFNLSQNQLDFLVKTMAVLPYQARYDRHEYYDSYGKFFIYGDSEKPIPESVKIYNKVGYAYGTLTDCAYIKDEENKVEFMLVATLLVNKDQIFNDNNYEYDEIGIPFLAQLGREIYQRELKR